MCGSFLIIRERLLSMALLIAVGVSGCAAHRDDPCAFGACGPGGATECFGYFSTCWNPWPVQCPPCPSPALNVPSREILPPATSPPAPPAPVEGMPTPVNPPPQSQCSPAPSS